MRDLEASAFPGRLAIGSSGWSYPSWRPDFYPAGTANEDFLSFYAARLPTVELNSTGYRLPSEEQFVRWAEQVPDGFRFAVKMPPLWQIVLHVVPQDEGLGADLDESPAPVEIDGAQVPLPDIQPDHVVGGRRAAQKRPRVFHVDVMPLRRRVTEMPFSRLHD